jgi:hypothetical protein
MNRRISIEDLSQMIAVKPEATVSILGDGGKRVLRRAN